MTTPADWTPPPPGSTRDQLPAHILNLIATTPYLSTACQTASSLSAATTAHPDRADELRQWRDRMHQRCRLNHKYTGQRCVCRCH